MRQTLQDFSYAFRQFRKRPTLSLAAVLTLALGLGINIAIFSLVDGIWLRPLDIQDPTHLVALKSVKQQASTAAEQESTASSFDEYSDIRKSVPALTSLMADSSRGAFLKTPEGQQMLLTAVVSNNYFSGMGLHASLGRLPEEGELRQIKSPVVVLGYRTWKQLFAGDPSILGRSIVLNGRPATVLGVMSASFHGTDRGADQQLYVPIATWLLWAPSEAHTDRGFREYRLYGRLASGASMEQAQAQLQSVAKVLEVKHPTSNKGRTLSVAWQLESSQERKGFLFLLLGLAGAVLLICCANIANLQLALNESRRREIAMRIAIGASRLRLFRQLLTESVLLTVAGLSLAFVLAVEAIHAVPRLIPAEMAEFMSFDLRFDHRVVFFALSMAVLSAFLFGILPALLLSRNSPLDAMRAKNLDRGTVHVGGRKVIVFAQVALSMMLLTLSGLMVRALIHLQTMDIGFNRQQNAALLEVSLDGPDSKLAAQFEAIRTRMSALPGVNAVTLSRVDPFPDSGGGATKLLLGPKEPIVRGAGMHVRFNLIDPDFLGAMGIGLLRGRNFSSIDTPGAPRVAIVSQTLAQHFFGRIDVVGEHLRLNTNPVTDLEIVGVTHDGQYADIAESPQPYLFLPLTQEPWHEVTVTLITRGDPHTLLPSAKKEVNKLNASIQVENTDTMKDRMDLATYPNRLVSYLVGSMGALALSLTAIGLFGVISYVVSRKTHDLGIRIALGANRQEILQTMLREGVPMIVGGAVLGALLSIAAGRGIGKMMYGVGSVDTLTLSASTAVLFLVAVAAMFVPGRRALNIDPVEALREE